ncbi:MAG: phosphate acyltransferase [Gammaproteobacteria bacterium]|nr:phosphate acyltransferase [Gammaproteobacteria bacterium]
MDALEQLAAAAARRRKKIVLPEGGDARVLSAAARVAERGLADLVLLGDAGEIANTVNTDSAALADSAAGKSSVTAGLEIIDPQNNPRADAHAEILLRARVAKGISRAEALAEIRRPLTLAACMVAGGAADGCVAGAAHRTADVVRAALQIVGVKDGGPGKSGDDSAADGAGKSGRDGNRKSDNTGDSGAPDKNPALASSFFLMQHDLPHQALRGVAVFADCALVIEPDAAQLARIAVDTADSAAALLGLKPRVALLSFSTAGSARHPLVDKVRRAGERVAALRPDIELLAEVQFDAAVIPDILRSKAPGVGVDAPANVFIFPDLQSANIGYKIAERIGGARAVGPILQGLRRPVNDLSRGCGVDDIVNLVAVTAVQAQAAD